MRRQEPDPTALRLLPHINDILIAEADYYDAATAAVRCYCAALDAAQPTDRKAATAAKRAYNTAIRTARRTRSKSLALAGANYRSAVKVLIEGRM